MASDEDNFDIDVYGDGEEDKTDQTVELSTHELPADGVDDGVDPERRSRRRLQVQPR